MVKKKKNLCFEKYSASTNYRGKKIEWEWGKYVGYMIKNWADG